MSHTLIEPNIKSVWIDGKKPRWFENRIKKVLRDKGVSVRKLRTVRRSQSEGSRIADMVAGLARSYYDKKNPKRINKYFKRLEKKLIITTVK